MRRWAAVTAIALLATGCSGVQGSAQTEDGWISLFDGETLNGWRASENPGTFRVENGVIVVHGPRAHLYYDGPVENHSFRNFEWKADVLTFPQANSGMYFHTEFLDTGWPAKGYEVQVNNSGSDPRRTGSLYAVDDVNEAPARDGEWFTQHVIVEGKRVRVLVNGRQVVDYTEPASAERPGDMSGRVLSSGTVALQGHDPNSQVHYRNIMIRPLPD
jgi:hypothetical protein